MATKTTTVVRVFNKKPKVRHKGVHAKTKTSKNKGADLYKKPSRGQD